MPDNQLVSNQADNYARWTPQERLFYEFTQEMMKNRQLQEQLRQQQLDDEQGYEEEVQNQQGGTANIMQTTGNTNPGLKIFMGKIKGTRPRLVLPHPARPRLPNAAQLAQSIETPIGVKKGSSGIHIKPSHKGLFTAKAKSAGMGVQGYASKVLSEGSGASAATRKQANFARNAKKWQH